MTAHVPLRDVLRRPDVTPLLLASVAGRFPLGMVPLALVLYARRDGGDYAAAGALAACWSLGLAAGTPLALVAAGELEQAYSLAAAAQEMIFVADARTRDRRSRRAQAWTTVRSRRGWRTVVTRGAAEVVPAPMRVRMPMAGSVDGAETESVWRYSDHYLPATPPANLPARRRAAPRLSVRSPAPWPWPSGPGSCRGGCPAGPLPVLAIALGVAYVPLALAHPTPARVAAAVVTGLPLPALLTACYLDVDRLAPAGTVAEAFGWIVTAFLLGSSAGAALAGALADHGRASAALTLAAGADVAAGLVLGGLRTATRAGRTAQPQLPREER